MSKPETPYKVIFFKYLEQKNMEIKESKSFEINFFFFGEITLCLVDGAVIWVFLLYKELIHDILNGKQ